MRERVKGREFIRGHWIQLNSNPYGPGIEL